MQFHDAFILFVLAHLIGDFVLQTNKIARLKSESMKGIGIHCAIVTAVQILFLAFFGLNGIIAAVLVGIIHFGLDYLKVFLKKYLYRVESVYFLIDQLIHLLVIWLFTGVFLAGREILHELFIYIEAAIILIILGYVSTVAVKILVRDLFIVLQKKAFFIKSERILDAFTAILLYCSWFVHPIAAIAAVITLFFFYRLLQHRLYSYDAWVVITKYAVLAATACIVLLI